jgi:hypothetical protein
MDWRSLGLLWPQHMPENTCPSRLDAYLGFYPVLITRPGNRDAASRPAAPTAASAKKAQW